MNQFSFEFSQGTLKHLTENLGPTLVGFGEINQLAFASFNPALDLGVFIEDLSISGLQKCQIHCKNLNDDNQIRRIKLGLVKVVFTSKVEALAIRQMSAMVS